MMGPCKMQWTPAGNPQWALGMAVDQPATAGETAGKAVEARQRPPAGTRVLGRTPATNPQLAPGHCSGPPPLTPGRPSGTKVGPHRRPTLGPWVRRQIPAGDVRWAPRCKVGLPLAT